MKLALLLLYSMVIPCFTACAKIKEKPINKETVKNLDLQRYMGKWYEIARFDHRFERDMVGVTAEYSFLPDGKIQVLNSGYKNSFSGTPHRSAGRSRRANARNPDCRRC